MATPKATTIKEAIKRFEDKTKVNATEAVEGKIIDDIYPYFHKFIFPFKSSITGKFSHQLFLSSTYLMMMMMTDKHILNISNKPNRSQCGLPSRKWIHSWEL